MRRGSARRKREDKAANAENQTDAADFVAETRAKRGARAAFWAARMGEGNAFQRELVGPATKRRLAVRPGERVLDELAEPTFGPGRAVPGVSWFNCPDIPPAPVAGARPVGASGGGAEPGDRAE